MKKISTIALLVMLAGCSSNNERPVEIREYRNKTNSMGDLLPVVRITHFTYNKHDYIRFDCGLGAKTSSIIHDPDCSCHDRSTEKL